MITFYRIILCKSILILNRSRGFEISRNRDEPELDKNTGGHCGEEVSRKFIGSAIVIIQYEVGSANGVAVREQNSCKIINKKSPT